jgi:multidrug resistance efflux pump/poly(3-hydroxybutyrate) depolymerase
MDGSTPNSNVDPQAPAAEVDDFDRSSPLSSSNVLRRALRDESGHEYYVYVPGDGAVDAPVLVAMHDIDRDARAQADAFAAFCEQHGVVLVAPHFPANRYPNYQRLGRSRNPVDERKSANEALDKILEEVASLSGVSVDRFSLFGFGGGGRFAMRYAMLNPERVAGVVIAEPGAYTFPNPARRFPHGIAPGRKRPDFEPDPSRFLRVPMTLIEHEGTPDTAPHPHLEDADRASEGAPAVNGRSWVEAMVEAAEVHGLTPRVTFQESEEPIGSFESFVAQTDLLERVCGRLFESSAVPHGLGLADSEATEGEGSDASFLSTLQSTLSGISNSAELRKWAIPSLLVFGLVVVLTPIFLWAHYRSTHVISRDAVLRGHIAEVGAQLNGVVKQIEVDSGDRVVAGQVVVRLEDRHFEAKCRQAESQLEKAQREVEIERLAIANERLRQKSSMRGVSADLAAARAEVQAAESRAEEALRRLELQRVLAKDGLVAEERVRAAETELRTARALVSASRAERTSAVAGKDLASDIYDGLSVREKRISVLESEISALEAEVALANANLESAVIRAPEDGAVVRRIVEPGSSTIVGQPIISLWLGDEIWVEAWIDEDQIGEVEVGSRATVTFKSHPDLEFGGVVESLAVATDIELPDSEVPQPRQDRMRDAPVVSARVKLDPHEEELFPGLSAVVAIQKKAP